MTEYRRKIYMVTLSCGHRRQAFSRKLGPGYYCGECKDKRDGVAAEVCGYILRKRSR